jgi:hypothetical protein
MGNRGKSKARKGNGIQDLAPKSTRGVKGGDKATTKAVRTSPGVTHSELVIVKNIDVASP